MDYGSMKEINLSNGDVAFVSDEDFDYLSKFKWDVICSNKDHFYKIKYAYTTVNTFTNKKIVIAMHRVVISLMNNDPIFLPSTYQVVDHIDFNGLNNIRENLRRCSSTQNQIHKRMQRNNSSGYKGINFDKKYGKWMVRITIDKRKRKFLGYFDSIHDAEKVYRQHMVTYYGEFAVPNKEQHE